MISLSLIITESANTWLVARPLLRNDALFTIFLQIFTFCFLVIDLGRERNAKTEFSDIVVYGLEPTARRSDAHSTDITALLG